MITNKRITVSSLLMMMVPTIAFANLVWPAMDVETKVSSIPIIALSLLIEFVFFKWLFQLNAKNAISYVVAANIASGVIGLVLRPLSGIAYDLFPGMLINWLFNWGTFNPVAWFSVPIIGGAINAFLELLTIKLIWKREFTKRNYLLTWGINTITVAAATIWVVIHRPQM